MLIRRFTADDYQDLAKLWNYAYPEGNKSAIDFLLLDKQRDPKLISKRWVAESENKTVGIAEYEHWEEFYHPRKYLMHLIVDQEHQKMGVGSELYKQLIDNIQTRKPLALWAWALEENTNSIEFLKSRDFAEVMRARQLSIDVQKFDPEPYAPLDEFLKQRGFEIKKFSKLSDARKRISQFHQIYCDSVKNMELPDKPTLPVLSTFNAWVEANPTIFDNHLIATRNDEIVGVCTLVPVGSAFYNEVTGVIHEYQNQGLAKGLLVRAIQEARDNSYRQVTTYVRDHNTSMIAITKKLGFAQERGRILFQKVFSES